MIKYRENIKDVIISELNKAESSIFVAVCWFTDLDIYNTILIKARNGIYVEIIISNDYTNLEKNKINWYLLLEFNCKVFLYKKGYLMHLKECIIDDKVFIDGTFNWTNNAKKNIESINVFYNNEFDIIKTKSEYNDIKKQSIPLSVNFNRNFNDSEIKKVNENFGVYDAKTEETILPAIYNEIRAISDGYFFVRRGNEGGYLNEFFEFKIQLNKEIKYGGDFEKGGAINLVNQYYWENGFRTYKKIKKLIDKNGETITEINDSYTPIIQDLWFVDNKLIWLNGTLKFSMQKITPNVLNIKTNNGDSVYLFINNDILTGIDFLNNHIFFSKKIQPKSYLISTLDVFNLNNVISIYYTFDKYKILLFYFLNNSRFFEFNITEYNNWKIYNRRIMLNDIVLLYFDDFERQVIKKNIILGDNSINIIHSLNYIYYLTINKLLKVKISNSIDYIENIDFKMVNKVSSVRSSNNVNSFISENKINIRNAYSYFSYIFTIISKNNCSNEFEIILIDKCINDYKLELEKLEKEEELKKEKLKKQERENIIKTKIEIEKTYELQKFKSNFVAVFFIVLGFFLLLNLSNWFGMFLVFCGGFVIYKNNFQKEYSNISYYIGETIAFLIQGGWVIVGVLMVFVIKFVKWLFS